MKSLLTTEANERPVRFAKLRAFLAAYHTSIVLAIGFATLIGVYIWNSLPAPYNLTYQFKCLTQQPTWVCRDGVVSFAVKRDGACSSHGGVIGRFPK